MLQWPCGAQISLCNSDTIDSVQGIFGEMVFSGAEWITLKERTSNFFPPGLNWPVVYLGQNQKAFCKNSVL